MASLVAHDVKTAPVTAPADARISEQLPRPETPPYHGADSGHEKDAYFNVVDEKSLNDETETERLDNLFPFPPLKGIPDEDQQLSIRALVIGVCLGAIVSASNIYLGLKTGWTFGASLFGGILGFVILKPLSRAAPRYLGGGYFGPKVRASVSIHFEVVLALTLFVPKGKCDCSDDCDCYWWFGYHFRRGRPCDVPAGPNVSQAPGW